MTLGFSSSLPSSKSGKTNGDLETVTFSSTAEMCDPLNEHPDLTVLSKPPHAPLQKGHTGLSGEEASVPTPAAGGGQESGVFLSFRCHLIIKALEQATF